MAQWPNPVTITVADGELYSGQLTLWVNITQPTEGATVATAAVPVQWAFAPGTQQTARVRVWSDLAKTLIAYDSGVMPTSSKSFTIPEGSLQTVTTYYMQVDITTTLGQAGSSDLRTFLTNYTPVNALATPTVQLIGNCPTFADEDLPGTRVRWVQATLAANEQFTRYSVWRRWRPKPWELYETEDVQWIRIASVTAVGTLSYVDRTTEFYKVFEYDVTFSVHNTATGNDLTSLRHSPAPVAYIENDWTYLHNIDDPTEYVCFYHLAGQLDSVDDIEEALFWGNTAAVLFVGDPQYAHVQLPGLPDVARGQLWDRLQALRTAQRLDGAVLMLRIGEQGKRMFCGLSHASEQFDQGQYTPSIDLVQVDHDEAVA